MNKDIFCAKCQTVTPHKGSVDANGEFLFECLNVTQEEVKNEAGEVTTPRVVCDRFVKFPADIDKGQFEKAVEKHEEGNTGQISLEGQEKKLKDFLSESPAEEVPQA